MTNRILKSGALAVVRAQSGRVLEIAEGILNGGIDVMEISYTNLDAPQSIDAVHEKYGDKILVGAGTILDGPSAKDAISHDVGFIYSPIFDKDVAELCNQYQIPYAPGCTTVSEAVEAMRAGATFIKIFPYGGILGPDAIKTIKTPIPDMPVLESGGVNVDNVTEWFNAGVEVVGIGGALSKGSPVDIAKNALELRKKIDDFKKVR